MSAEKYRVRKGIPTPRGKYKKYPFERMKIGDCFDMADASPATRNKVLCAARDYRVRYQPNFKIKTRIVNVNHEKRIRVWRVRYE